MWDTSQLDLLNYSSDSKGYDLDDELADEGVQANIRRGKSISTASGGKLTTKKIKKLKSWVISSKALKVSWDIFVL